MHENSPHQSHSVLQPLQTPPRLQWGIPSRKGALHMLAQDPPLSAESQHSSSSPVSRGCRQSLACGFIAPVCLRSLSPPYKGPPLPLDDSD